MVIVLESLRGDHRQNFERAEFSISALGLDFFKLSKQLLWYYVKVMKRTGYTTQLLDV